MIFGEKGLAGDASLKLLATPDANRRPVRRVPVRRNRGKNATRPAPTPSRFGSPDPVTFATRYFWRPGNGGFSHPFGKLPRAGPQGLGRRGWEAMAVRAFVAIDHKMKVAVSPPTHFCLYPMSAGSWNGQEAGCRQDFWSFVDHGL